MEHFKFIEIKRSFEKIPLNGFIAQKTRNVTIKMVFFCTITNRNNIFFINGNIMKFKLIY